MRRTLAWILLAALGLGLAPGLADAQCLKHSFVSGKPDGADASLVRPSDWNDCHQIDGGTTGQLFQRDTGASDGWSWVAAPDIYGPSYLTLTNKTGGSLAVNDVVAIDTANDSAVTLGDTLNSLQTYVVAAESISNNVAGKFYHRGLVTVKVQGNVTRGRYLVKSATTLAAQDSGTLMTSSASPPAGAFAVATTAYGGGGAGTVTAVLLGATLPQVDPASLPGASYFQFEEMTPPSTPSANRVRLFVPTETPAVNRLNVLDATGQTVALSGVLFREVGNPIKNIVNTTTETSLFTTAPTIKGGTLGTSRGLRVTVFLDLLNDTGGGITTTVRMKYGGTTFGTLNGVAIDASATRFAFRYDGLLHAVGATNAQIGSLSGLYDPSAGNAGVTGGQPGAALPAGHSPHTGLTVDSTADQTLEITAQHSSASSNLSVRPYLILVELL